MKAQKSIEIYAEAMISILQVPPHGSCRCVRKHKHTHFRSGLLLPRMFLLRVSPLWLYGSANHPKMIKKVERIKCWWCLHTWRVELILGNGSCLEKEVIIIESSGKCFAGAGLGSTDFWGFNRVNIKADRFRRLLKSWWTHLQDTVCLTTSSRSVPVA